MDLDFDVFKAGSVSCYGISLVEVFNVKINKKVEVYGTVRVEEDDKGTFMYLYDRKQIDIESLKPEGTLSLTSPTRLIPAAGTITFFVDLKDKYGNEFIKGSFRLNLIDDNLELDKYLVACINGKLGSATVYYTMPIVALKATIEIQLIKGDNGVGYSDIIKGKIVGSYGNDYDNCVSEEVKRYSCFRLYEKSSKDKPLRLKNEDLLPLSRSTVVVAARCLIIVEMNLDFHHSDGHKESLRGFHIEAPASSYGGEHIQEIPLKHGVLKVEIFCDDVVRHFK